MKADRNLKYEFVDGDEKVVLPGVVVKRIRALVAISATMLSPAVSPGDLGGYIQGIDNLDARVSGNAWVYGDAWVSGNARVYGDAWVYGDARVYGDAWVYGNAHVYGGAWVYGNAHVYGGAWVSGNARVYGDAWVYGNAHVYGGAWVSGNAHVYGDAWVSGNARVYGDGMVFWASKVGTENGTLTVYNAKDSTLLVTRGCFIGTPEQFLAASANKHDERTQHEYRLLIEVATSRIETTRAAIKDGKFVECAE